MSEIVRLLQCAEPNDGLERCWNWQAPSLDIEGTLRRRGHQYNGYPVSAGYFGAYSVDGLALALHAVYHTTTFGDAIETCVNHCGDADSTAAIAGQVAGSYYGWAQGVERPFKDQLHGWDRGEIALRGALLFLGDGQPQQHQAEGKADTKVGI